MLMRGRSGAFAGDARFRLRALLMPLMMALSAAMLILPLTALPFRWR